MEKDKKYNIILGLMVFFFILFVGVCVAWGLGIIGIKSNNTETAVSTNNINSTTISKVENDTTNIYPKVVDINSEEIKDFVNFVNSKIKFMTPSEKYTDNLTDAQMIEAAMFFYINDNYPNNDSEYIYTKDLSSVIEKYFGITDVGFGELKGYNYSYIENKQAYIAPFGWGSSLVNFIKKIEYIDKDTVNVYIDQINTARFDNSANITKENYTDDMIENKLIVTIKLKDNNSFIVTNYGYLEKDIYNT